MLLQNVQLFPWGDGHITSTSAYRVWRQGLRFQVSRREFHTHRGGARNFCLGGPSCNTNIFIKTTPYTHINTNVFFYYIHTFFYLISCIYTHIQQKKSLIFSIKIMFDSYLS